MQAKMAATLFRALAILCLFANVFVSVGGETFLNGYLRQDCLHGATNFAFRMHYSRHLRVKRAVVRWDSRGLLLLAAPEKCVVLDITTSMDIHPNPGWEDRDRDAVNSTKHCKIGVHRRENTPMLDRCDILKLRKSAGKPLASVLGDLKELGILKYRGPGKRRDGRGSDKFGSKMCRSERKQPIEVVRSRRPAKSPRELRRTRYLTSIPRDKPCQRDNKAEFAVPKCMFINICSLSKTKNKVRASVALEADLKNHDIDVCVVTETHLKLDQPDAVVNIADFNIYRRDRNWSGLDMRNKGGVAVYVKKNLSVVDVYLSRLYEVICITLCLPTGHRFLVCGIYHPPKHSYAENDLMNYLIDYTDNVLDAHPQTVIVLGGDLNQMDMDQLQQLSGWNVLVDFPTRGDSHLDNCLTNRPDLFARCYPFHVSTKSDHRGVILPAGSKLRPVRRKVHIRDRRLHRKHDLYTSLAGEDWREVLETKNVNEAVNKLETTIRGHLDRCMPVRVVTMSSRDPAWMTPLVKALLRSKSRVSDEARLKELNKRISEVISENRKQYNMGVIGSKQWWKGVDLVSQRRNAARITLDRESLDQLNEYFGNLCSDTNYIRPVDIHIDPDVKAPTIPLGLV